MEAGAADIEDEPPTLINLDGDFDIGSSSTIDDKKSHFPIPVTILSGFLGSGKSTLIKYILNSPNHGKRIAIIENEYAPSVLSEQQKQQQLQQQELTVESMIIKDGVTNTNLMTAANLMFELPNGCICCTVKDTLVSTLEMLLSSAAAKSIDYIIIECSGMANPGGLASIFWLDEEEDEEQQQQLTKYTSSSSNKLRLDGVATCVDAKHIGAQLQDTKDDGDEAAQQIAYADRIILNKVDLVDEDEISQIENIITSINPTAPILKTCYSKVPDLSWILDANCFNAERASKEYEQWNSQVFHSNSKCCSTTCTTNHHHHHHHHKHTSNITTVVLYFQGSVILRMVKTWMARILWINQDKDDDDADDNTNNSDPLPHYKQRQQTKDEPQMNIMRVKGILSVQHENSGKDDINFCDDFNVLKENRRKYVVQAVHDLWEILPCETLTFQDNEERCCKVIVIGRFLDETYLQDTFSLCMAL
jgi:G3E family GTPase